jgi:hypothetical protein
VSDLKPGERVDKSGREIELKLRVDDLAGLMRIAIASGGLPEGTVVQRNSFYDTPDRLLGSRGLVVRVRREYPSAPPSNRAQAKIARESGEGIPVRTFVTAKGPGQRDGQLTAVREEEVEIDDDDFKRIVGGEVDPVSFLEKETGSTESRRVLVGAIRSTLAGRKTGHVGEFVNERTRIPVKLGKAGSEFHAVLELDRTRFPGEQVHHEVEMEVPEGVDNDVAGRAFDDLFSRAGVAGRTAAGKARRFFAALRGERLE